jgi:hypothetical protein
LSSCWHGCPDSVQTLLQSGAVWHGPPPLVHLFPTQRLVRIQVL